jgi:hypothetical protein
MYIDLLPWIVSFVYTISQSASVITKGLYNKPNRNTIRIMSVNCRSLISDNKKIAMQDLIETHNPEIILGWKSFIFFPRDPVTINVDPLVTIITLESIVIPGYWSITYSTRVSYRAWTSPDNNTNCIIAHCIVVVYRALSEIDINDNHFVYHSHINVQRTDHSTKCALYKH